jgi:hypothetical protein
MNNDKNTVSLVLGSGGARGLAHIGIIQVLEEKGYEITSISGCSIGALIGGVYAAGKLDEYEAWMRDLSKLDIVNMMDIAWEGGGLVKGDKIIQKMVDIVGDLNIEDLPISFTAVATELGSGMEVWISKGRLFDAIRSSISLPLFFTPFERQENLLVDGGIVNPVPIAPTFDDDTERRHRYHDRCEPRRQAAAKALDEQGTGRRRESGEAPGQVQALGEERQVESLEPLGTIRRHLRRRVPGVRRHAEHDCPPETGSLPAGSHHRDTSRRGPNSRIRPGCRNDRSGTESCRRSLIGGGSGQDSLKSLRRWMAGSGLAAIGQE